MTLPRFQTWARTVFRKHAPRRRQGRRPAHELLEDRVTPSAVSWTGNGDGVNWSDPHNWSTGQLPGPADDVTINSPGAVISHATGNDSAHSLQSENPILLSGGSLSLAADSVIDDSLIFTGGTFTNSGNLDLQALIQTGGFTTFTGPGTVTIETQWTWSDGTMSGPGHTVLNGTADLSGGFFTALDNRTVDNHGSASIAPGDGITFKNNAVWNNDADGTFVLRGAASLENFFAGTAAFNNAGLLQKTGTGTAAVNIALNNTGTVDVQTGTLTLTTGTSSGTFDLEDNSVLNVNDAFTPPYSLTDGAAVIDTGTLQVGTFDALNVSGGVSVENLALSGGTVTALPGSSLTVDNLAVTGGTLTGAGTVTVNGNFTWNGGTLSGTGPTFLEGTSNVGGAFTTLSGATVYNDGTATFNGGGISFNGKAAWNNDPGGTTFLQGAFPLGSFGNPSASFNNFGLLRKPDPGGMTVPVPLLNSGTVDVGAGVLTLSGGGFSSGTFDLEGLSALNIGGTYTLADGATVTGTGTLQVNAFNTLNTMGSVSVQNLHVGGTVNVLGGGSSLDVQSLLNLDGGTLTGPGAVTVDATLFWTGGTLSGTGQTFLEGTSTVFGGFSTTIDTRTVTNDGTATLVSGPLNFKNGAVWNNGAGGTFVLQNTASLAGVLPGSGTFNNAGLLQKTGAIPTPVGVTLNNTGTVDVQAGSLTLSTGSSSGTFDLEDGSVLSIGGLYTLQDGAASIGTGTLQVSNNLSTLNVTGAAAVQNLALANNATLTGPGALTVNGTFTWTGGTVSGPGQTFLEGTSTLSGGFFFTLDTRTITNDGTATLVSGPLNFKNGAVWNNDAGGTFVLQNNATLVGVLPGSGTFNNAGLLQKTGPFTTTLGVALNNTGTVDVQGGALLLSTGSSSGNFNVAAGASLGITSAFPQPPFALQDGATGTGAGTIQVTNPASVSVSGNVNLANLALLGFLNGGTVTVLPGSSLAVDNLALAGGTLTGPGDVTVNNTFTWTLGTLSGTGRTFLEGTSNLSGGFQSKLTDRTVFNDGTATFTVGPPGPGITFSGNAVWNNDPGSTAVLQGFPQLGNFFASPAAAFNNAGLLQKTGAGTAFVAIPLTNTGTIQVQAGALSLGVTPPGFQNSGTVTVAPFSAFFVAGNYVQSDGSTTVDGTLGANTVLLNGGTLNGVGFINASVVNAAEVDPGDSPGVLTINGNYTQTAAGTLTIEIGGLSAGSQYDRLVVNGFASLNGTFNVVLLNNFQPNPGDTFRVLTFASHTGDFATYNGLDLGNGNSLSPQFNPTALDLVTVPNS
jgi:hypothetical protein